MKPVRKVESLRSMKIPIITTGTAHKVNGGFATNPLSSKVLNTAGNIGSVNAVRIMPAKPSASPCLYGPNKRSTRSKLTGNFIKICYVFPLRHDEESGALPFLRINGAGEAICLSRSSGKLGKNARVAFIDVIAQCLLLKTCQARLYFITIRAVHVCGVISYASISACAMA